MKLNIKIHELSKTYGRTAALQNFCYATQESRCIGIVGRNGAGKTTLLKILVGLIDKSSGLIDINNSAGTISHYGPQHAYYLADTATVLQDFKSLDYLNFILSLNHAQGIKTDTQLRDSLLKDLRLFEDKKKRLSEYSKGMKRKLELVAALSTNVPIVVADELCTGLDVPSKKFIEGVIKRSITTQGKNFIISSHDVNFIGNISDEVIVIDNGKCMGVIKKSGQSFESFYANICSLFANEGD